MKLLMTADAVGGVWTYALDLARGLKAHGIETTLAINGPSPAESPAEVQAIATGLPLDWLAETPGEVEAAGRALAALAGDLGCDLVQLNSPAYAAGAGFRQPVVGVQHSCTATWWRAVKGAEPWPADFAWRFDFARRGLLACDRTVAPTRAFAAAVAETYGVNPPTVVWNGRSASFPLDRGGNGKGGEGGGIITAGRLWDESKGVATLDAAAARLSAPVLAAGPMAAPGSPNAAAFEHLSTPGVLSAVELRTQLAEAAIFVSPSLYEPFGLSVLEAAQLARPLVLSDISTFRELWDGAAVFFPPRDAGALAAALQALLDDPPRRDALGAAAAARARRYTVERMAERMAGLFRGLVSA